MIKMEEEKSKARFFLKCAAMVGFLAGIFMFGAGIGVIVAAQYHAAISSIPFQTASTLLLVAGILSILAGAVAYYLVKKFSVASKPKHAHTVFLGILALGAVCAFVAGILGLIYISKLETGIEKDLYEKLQLYGVTGQYETLRNLDRVQEKDNCCGVINYADWRKTPYGGNRFDKVPDSCCKEQKHACGFEFKDDAIDKEGCLEIVKIKIKKNLLLVGVGGLMVGLIEVGLVIALVTFGHRDIVYRKRGVELTSKNELLDTPSKSEQWKKQEENTQSEDARKAKTAQTPDELAVTPLKSQRCEEQENMQSEDGRKAKTAQTPHELAVTPLKSQRCEEQENMQSEDGRKAKTAQTPRETSDRHEVTPSVVC